MTPDPGMQAALDAQLLALEAARDASAACQGVRDAKLNAARRLAMKALEVADARVLDLCQRNVARAVEILGAEVVSG